MRSGTIVLLLALGIAAVIPIAKSETVPISDIKLIAEESVSSSMVAASSKNGNKNGKNAHQAGAANVDSSWFSRERIDSNSQGELVKVEIR